MHSRWAERSVIALVGTLAIAACQEEETSTSIEATDSGVTDHAATPDVDRDAGEESVRDVAAEDVDSASTNDISVEHEVGPSDAGSDAIEGDVLDASLDRATSVDANREGSAEAGPDAADALLEVGRNDAGPPPVHMPSTTQRLAYDVVDAEYDSFLDRIVIASKSPRAALHVLDPTTGQDVEVALPSAPTAVSVSPNGRLAATGHDGEVALIDLVQLAPVNRCYVGPGIMDLALTDDAQAYVSIPLVQLRGSDLTTCVDLQFTEFLRPGRAKLQYDGTSHVLYWVDDSGDISVHRDDVSMGNPLPVPTVTDNSRFDYCDNCWLGDDGRLFLNCQRWFDSGKIQPLPVTFNFQHLYARHGRVIVIPSTYALQSPLVPFQSAREYDSAFNPLADFSFRAFDSDAGTLSGRFVFLRNDLSAVFAIVQHGQDAAASFAIESFQP